MAGLIINNDLVMLALEKAEGRAFENFFHAFYPAIDGEFFIPLGGTGDGGADAFQDRTFEGKESGYFYQASIVKDVKAKIRQTVKRLRESGREPKTLVYVTPNRINQIDKLQVELSRELATIILIRDANFIAPRVNQNDMTKAAFNTHLRPAIDYLNKVGGTDVIVPSKHVSSPSVYVFLRQELDRRQGKFSLVNAMADGLIFWALEETDPNQNIVKTKRQIIEEIEREVPASRTILHGIIPQRLEALSKMSKAEGRPVQWHSKLKGYCLAYNLREYVSAQNLEDEGLRVNTLAIFEQRISRFTDDSAQIKAAAEYSLKVVQSLFEQEGIELAAFIKGNHNTPPYTLQDHVEKTLTNNGVKQETYEIIRQAITENLRESFYNSTEHERLLFSKMAETYTLLFCLNSEPRVIEYFQNMASDFYLYVGTDILIRALCERFTTPENQAYRNTLKVIRDTGGELILTEPVLDEVHTHLEAADYEYKNKYRGIPEPLASRIGQMSDRVMIRAYFDAVQDAPPSITPPTSWEGFVEQFCDYGKLHTPIGREQLRKYLLAQFNLGFQDKTDICSLCDSAEVAYYADKILEDKSDERLAYNDALMAVAVYGRRREKKEFSRVSQFGYRTWWLTNESRIFRHTKELVEKHSSRYMMRPEFILNFLAITPSTVEIKKTYKSVFPTLLGIRLARGVDSEELTTVLKKVREALELEPGRREAIIAELSDQLKSDFRRPYSQNFVAV